MIDKLRFLFSVLAFVFTCSSGVYAQGNSSGPVTFDKTVHDFGDILVTDGPVSCSFTMTNVSQKDVVIGSVVSSCGCTDVDWTRTPLKPGAKGTITATYNNEDGAYPFEKTLTVYISGVSSPTVLRLRGIVHEKKLSLSEMYSVRFGDFALKESSIKCGNLQQGQQKSGEVTVANLSGKPLTIKFEDVSEDLTVKVSPNPVPAGSTATMSFTVNANRSKWGKNFYYATPVVNGEKSGRKIEFWAVTKENFSGWTKEQKDAGANPIFTSSTYSFKPMNAGATVTATFEFTNKGKSNLVVYKIDSDSERAKAGTIPTVKPGEKASFKVTFDTKGMDKGEVLNIITLYTNSPLRPIVNLYITGFIN